MTVTKALSIVYLVAVAAGTLLYGIGSPASATAAAASHLRAIASDAAIVHVRIGTWTPRPPLYGCFGNRCRIKNAPGSRAAGALRNALPGVIPAPEAPDGGS
jgi:hypothetical protein